MARSRVRRRIIRALVALVAIASVATAVPLLREAAEAWREGNALAERQLSGHGAWSFPARIVSEAVPVTSPADRLIAEARARSYREQCPEPGPGELCPTNRRVAPRNGRELEPVTLGWLVGPDGELRAHLSLEEAPQVLVDAILAAEDQRVWKHPGVDLLAMGRAALANLRRQTFVQGGSTLTMQLTRVLVGSRDKTLRRKLREAVMAVALERRLGKEGVLRLYLDAPYLGRRAGLPLYGFEAASEHYFGKPARELDLAEAATLAAMLPSPARYSPDSHPEAARARRNLVLEAMAKEFGYDITKASGAPISLAAPEPLISRHPSYVSAVRLWLEERLGPEVVYREGLTVTAAVDLPFQRQTEATLGQETAALQAAFGTEVPLQSAAVLLDVSTGRMRAVWGGVGATSARFHRALQARRQPGSAFKPLVYALALERGEDAEGAPLTAATPLPNRPRLFRTDAGPWRPQNLGSYSDTACLAYGLAFSQNLATAELLVRLGGPDALLEFAGRLGFDTTHMPREMGLALGQGEVTVLEMAQFAAVVANGGRKVQGTPVLQVVDRTGAERIGPPSAGAQVLSRDAAGLTREMMRLVVEMGTGTTTRGSSGRPGYRGPAIGKTGTTDQERDTWFVGATPDYAAVVWLGYDQPRSLGDTASHLAAPLWGLWLHTMLGEGPHREFPQAPWMLYRTLCRETGLLAGPTCSGITAPFLPGTEPHERCGLDHPPPESSPELLAP